MTQISGQIYQLTSPDGNTNRFPRTVIEAVYGLSSYLQTQFGNLASVYVPQTRTVNSKALSADITLNLDDIADGSTRKLANYLPLAAGSTKPLTGVLYSSVANGTAPFSITSGTKVTNLNADKLDDYEAVDFTSAIQSLWSQIDSLSTKDDFDELFATSFYADTIAASTSHLGLVSITGNTTIGGTLGVTGNTTLSGTLTVGASNAKKATTLYGALTVSDGATLSSTLSVASTSTLTGRVGIGGAPDSTNALKVTGVAYATTGIYSDGYITAGAAAQSSDERLKSNIKEVMDGMSVISKLTPREWIWNEKNSYLSGKMGAGLIAQEVAKVLPFSVVDEGDYLALNYNVLHAYEISALQSHEARIKALEIENRKLKQKLNIN